MEMLEDLQGEVANRPLRNRGKNGVSDFAKGLGEDTRDAVGQDQGDRHRDGLRRGFPQRVDCMFVEDRDVDVGDLGQNQQHHRDCDADAQADFTLWPQMAAYDGDHRPGTRGAHLGNAIVGGRRHGRKNAFSGAQGVWRRGRGPSIVSLTLK